MKYIIEVEDKPFELLSEDGFTSEKLFRVKGFNSLVFDWNGLNMLTPYTAPDLEQVRKEAYDKGYDDYRDKLNLGEIKNDAFSDGYKCGLADAWEAARKISMAEINGRCSWKSMKNIFGIEIPSKIFKNFTASEAIEKLKACEQEQGAEIKVGNEVKAFEKKPFIVTGFGYGYDEKDVYCYGFVTENGISTSAKKDSCVRTGRHFPEIAAIFEKMREES